MGLAQPQLLTYVNVVTRDTLLFIRTVTGRKPAKIAIKTSDSLPFGSSNTSPLRLVKGGQHATAALCRAAGADAAQASAPAGPATAAKALNL